MLSHRIVLTLGISFLLFPLTHRAHAQSDEALTARLRAQDTALLSAVHNGGRSLWEQTTTPDFAYIEEGYTTLRPEFLKELVPDDGAVLANPDL